MKRRGRKSAAQTPAPKSERIYGSKKNPKGSASSEKSAKQIKLSEQTIKALQNKLAEFKKNHKTKKITINDLKAVYRRGLGAYSSSHRPFITGGLTNKFHNMFTFDGGFNDYPYLDKERILHVSPNMWNNINNTTSNSISNNIKRSIQTLSKYSEFFSISKNNLIELFDDGYQDAKKHKQILDEIFTPKIEIEFDSDVIEI